jgi:aminoglycoside phosphotransferase family enzyme/predicted kinase
MSDDPGLAGDAIASQEETIAFLSRPATYGTDRVDLAETHTSIVFLTGDRAYKLKKAVRYTYLDYSTTEARRRFCEAELAVNRALAPDLYLSVEPVARRTDGSLRLGGAGTAVDWVVAMHRFDAADQFDRMAERHALPLDLMRLLADRIAEVHRAAAPTPQFGGEAGLRQATLYTIQNLRLAVGHGLERDAVESWIARVSRAIDRAAPLLERRRIGGHVRSCHGDLHLSNICLFRGSPTLFDAIEFDPALSCTDILYDLAFLLMDLRFRGLDAHGNAVFNRYLDRLDEMDGIEALPLFMSARAGIRAQIAIAAVLHRHAAGDTAAAEDKARRYLGLADALLAPSAPCLVAIGGVSGTGKSTLAYRLAPALAAAPGARVIRSDMLRKRAAGIRPETRLPAEAYTKEAHAENHRRLLNEARIALEAGRGAIVDAVLALASERDELEALARGLGVPFQGLWLDAPVEVLERRIASRRDDASDAGIAVMRQQTIFAERPSGWAMIDAAASPDAMAATAAKILGLPPGIPSAT